MLSSLEDRTRLAEIEAQIRDLERTLVELRAEKMLVQERLNSCTYPVLTLPNEIVSEIFIHFLPLRPLCPPLTGRLSPTTLTQICRRWRQVAQATPELWRAILFADDRIPLEEQFLIFDLWLSTSRGYPLSIRMDRPLGSNPVSLQEIFPAVVPHQACWEDLTLHISGSRLPSLDGPMPLLRFLDLELYNGLFFEVHAAPLLRTACLNNAAAFYGTLPWSQLTCLTFHDVERNICTSVLEKATNLVHCRLDLSGPSRDHPDIVLPSLESLTFDCTSHTPGYLTTLIVPALRSLEISERSLGQNPIRSLNSFISKSGCRLQEVHITGKRTVAEDSYRDAFPSIPKFSFAERL